MWGLWVLEQDFQLIKAVSLGSFIMAKGDFLDAPIRHRLFELNAPVIDLLDELPSYKGDTQTALDKLLNWAKNSPREAYQFSSGTSRAVPRTPPPIDSVYNN